MSSDWLDSLPPLRAIIETHDLMPQKKLGQNFLLDLNITDKIARHAGPIEGRKVIEIGPGPGGLTRAILRYNPSVLHVVEKDPRCIGAIRDLQAYCPEVLHIHPGDALKFSEQELGEGKYKIIANLPYNIGTELIFKWLESLPLFEDFTLMLQKEVAERIVAKPGSGTYGKLSILCQWRCEASIAFHLPPDVFFPPPKVTSSVIRLVPRPEPLHPAPEAALRTLLATAFSQRRKMLRASLRSIIENASAFLEAQGINPEARPEELSIADFCKLACALPRPDGQS